jgi:hypothetical protein
MNNGPTSPSLGLDTAQYPTWTNALATAEWTDVVGFGDDFQEQGLVFV